MNNSVITEVTFRAVQGNNILAKQQECHSSATADNQIIEEMLQPTILSFFRQGKLKKQKH